MYSIQGQRCTIHLAVFAVEEKVIGKSNALLGLMLMVAFFQTLRMIRTMMMTTRTILIPGVICSPVLNVVGFTRTVEIATVAAIQVTGHRSAMHRGISMEKLFRKAVILIGTSLLLRAASPEVVTAVAVQVIGHRTVMQKRMFSVIIFRKCEIDLAISLILRRAINRTLQRATGIVGRFLMQLVLYSLISAMQIKASMLLIDVFSNCCT